MIVALVRHPITDLPEGVCYGRLDAEAAGHPWTDLVASIQAIGPARVWTSSAIRCLKPTRATGLALVVDPRLQEFDFGAWEGRRWDDIARTEIDVWAADPVVNAPPGGESGAALIERVSTVWRQIRERREDCAVISHAGPLKVLAALAHGRAPDLFAASAPFGSIDVIAC